jgi:uncharacterized protein YkwD
VHKGLDGSNSYDRIQRYGDIDYLGDEAFATENIYFGPDSKAEDQLLKLVVDFKKVDVGHRKAALSPKISRIGLGASTSNSVYRFITVHDLASEFIERP